MISRSRRYRNYEVNNESNRNGEISCLRIFAVFSIVFFLIVAAVLYRHLVSKLYDTYTNMHPVLLNSWHLVNQKNETVHISFNRLTNGYKVVIEIKRSCSGPRSLMIKHFFGQDALILMLQRQRIGPDEIFIQLEGASIQTVIAHADDFCGKYFAILQVPRSGIYRLKISRTR